MKVYKIQRDDCNVVIESNVENIPEYLKDSDIDTVWTITILEMSEEEYSNLKESDGF